MVNQQLIKQYKFRHASCTQQPAQNTTLFYWLLVYLKKGQLSRDFSQFVSKSLYLPGIYTAVLVTKLKTQNKWLMTIFSITDRDFHCQRLENTIIFI